jgi:hypothetical protein
MKRLTVLVLLTCGLFAASFLAPPADARDEKTPDIKEIMKKVNSPTGLYATVMRELKEQDVMWDDIKEPAQEIARLAALLGKNDPPQGDKASWQKLTKAYADNAKALEKAVAKRDKKGAVAAQKLIGEEAVCNACHKVHRKE